MCSDVISIAYWILNRLFIGERTTIQHLLYSLNAYNNQIIGHVVALENMIFLLLTIFKLLFCGFSASESKCSICRWFLWNIGLRWYQASWNLLSRIYSRFSCPDDIPTTCARSAPCRDPPKYPASAALLGLSVVAGIKIAKLRFITTS